MPDITREQINKVRAAIHQLDCGAHYCRYCDAGTWNEWLHRDHCAYAVSVRVAGEAKRILDSL